MRRAAALLCLLALTACSGGDEEIAVVGGDPVLLSDIEALFEDEAVPGEAFRQMLFTYMAIDAASAALADEYGVTIDPAVVGEQQARLEAELARQGATPEQLFGIPGASAALVPLEAEGWALRDAALAALVADPEVVDGLFADPATLTTVCVKHILVAGEEEAEAVEARLAAGEDFAAVADEVSLDTGTTGGDLGCGRATRFVPVFAQAAMAAPLGELAGPVQSSFGWHLLVVSERTTPTRDDYLADPEAVLSEDELTGIWVDWFTRVIAEADAWVDEEYGVWTANGIEAPATGSDAGTSGG